MNALEKLTLVYQSIPGDEAALALAREADYARLLAQARTNMSYKQALRAYAKSEANHLEAWRTINQLMEALDAAYDAIEHLGGDVKSLGSDLKGAYAQLVEMPEVMQEVKGLTEKLASHRAALQLKQRNKAAADQRHGKPGGSRAQKAAILEIWASGKYSGRTLCAEQEWEGIGFGSYDTARKALQGSPDPQPWPGKKGLA